jgi:uncharacterized protein YndB with AHSA1/START domain
MNAIAGVVVAVVGVLVIVGGAGALLPKEHQVQVSERFAVPPEQLWVVLTDFPSFPEWRSSVRKVERLPEQAGHETWREVDTHGDGTPYVTDVAEPPRRLVRRIADPALPFGGSWEFRLVPVDGGVELTIREDGEVRNVIYRFLSKFVFGHRRSIDGFMADLRARLALSKP